MGQVWHGVKKKDFGAWGKTKQETGGDSGRKGAAISTEVRGGDVMVLGKSIRRGGSNQEEERPKAETERKASRKRKTVRTPPEKNYDREVPKSKDKLEGGGLGAHSVRRRKKEATPSLKEL